MKIVRIIARLNVGGPARHVVWLTAALNGGEHSTVLIAGTVPEGEEDMSWFAEANSVKPDLIPEMSRELSPKDAVSLWKVFRRLVRERPDIIHTHTAKAGTVGRVAAFLYRWLLWKDVSVVHTFHGHVFHSYYGNLKTSLFLFVERTLARFATDRIVVISERQRDEIRDRFRVGRPGQFTVIPLGLDIASVEGDSAARESFRAEIGAAEDDIIVGFVGRLTEIKNIPLLLEAVAGYCARAVEDLPKMRFVIIGDGHLRGELESRVAELGIGDRLVFLGNRTDPGVFYAGLDIVALCSLNEGTPLTLIEAMANRIPFVSSDVGGVADLAGPVTDRRTNFSVRERGATYPSGDAVAFLEALLHLASEAALRSGTGIRGRRFVEENYSRDRLVRDIRELYLDLRRE
jgi:glycosyltransferase involved in cell wall biosynthesis